eukprot:535765_1
MNTFILISTISVLNVACNNELKMATYNTFQIPLNPIAPITAPKIINEILNSDIDIMCLQEIFSPTGELQFQNALKSKYPYAYSEANTLELQNVPSHSACRSDQINLLRSDCITTKCAPQFQANSLAFIGCASMMCRTDIFPLIDTECQYCLIAQHDGKKSLSDAVNICSQQTPIKYALTGGTIILSKYPILNKKIHTFHSNVLHRNILITEIDVSKFTRPDEGIKDTIFFGCTHLVSTDGTTYFPTSQMEVDNKFTSYNQLHKWQTENIFNYFRNVDPFISNNNDIGLVIAGDFNVGDRVFADNFNIWRNMGFIDMYDLVQHENAVIAPCTYCADPNGVDKNTLAIGECKTCKVPDAAIDHILVYEDHFNHISPFSYNRIFRKLYDIKGAMLPLSDHWGVMVEVELFR